MQLDDLLKQTSEWVKGTGAHAEIVMSSRVRLARNLNKYPFSHWAKKKQEEEVLRLAKEGIEKSSYLKNHLFLEIKDLSEIDRMFLVERHLMSKEHAVNSSGKALAVTPEEIASIMINEEDHLRMQVMQSGFNLPEAWAILNKLDNELSDKLDFAYSLELGYLTACPTNTGTGMRASVMLHLPCLVVTKKIGQVLQAISKLSLTARGLYGEGTEASGNFFQISNQVTLGHKEEDIIDNLERIIKQIIDHEKNAREALLGGQQRRVLEDRIWRSYGTLKSARIITSSETLELLSSVRLGIDIGLIKNIDRKVVNELFVTTQPAHLQKIEGKTLSAPQRDTKRAELLREKLKT